MTPERASIHRNSLGSSSRSRNEPFWISYPDEDILDLRFSDLNLRLEGTEIEARIQQLYSELGERGLNYRPLCWLSSEWFSPYDTPGIAIPFYLAHPRLKQLEQRQTKSVEGGTKTWCMQLLRHETGHAYELAYRLTRRREWQRIFGRSSAPYPNHYSPNPLSQDYVQHLDWWYAQSHPVEDFAETFAVWLRSGTSWRRRYKNWPAIQKLEYVNDLMAELSGKSPLIHSGKPVEPLHELQQTLREHYQKKRETYGSEIDSRHDRHLKRLFAPGLAPRKFPPASTFLRRVAAKIPQSVSDWNGSETYALNMALKHMTQRCRELGLRVPRSERRMEPEAVRLLTKQTKDYLYNKKYRLAL